MNILVFSDLHRDTGAAESVVAASNGADVVVGAGDLATKREGLQPMVDILARMSTPLILVPGNGESDEELRQACTGLADVHVLHGDGIRLGGVDFFGIGGAVPVTPFGAWSYDLSEDEARTLLSSCPEHGVLVSHSPPFGHCDADGQGRHLGSRAVLETMETRTPQLVVSGHIHASWGAESRLGNTLVVNAGPRPRLLTL